MISLLKVKEALLEMGVDITHLEVAIAKLHEMQTALDEVEVKGRKSVDTLLGCMMAIEQIIGVDNHG